MKIQLPPEWQTIIKAYSLRVFEAITAVSGFYAINYAWLAAIIPPKIFAIIVVAMGVIGWIVRFMPQFQTVIATITGEETIEDALKQLSETKIQKEESES